MIVEKSFLCFVSCSLLFKQQKNLAQTPGLHFTPKNSNGIFEKNIVRSGIEGHPSRTAANVSSTVKPTVFAQWRWWKFKK